jgi:hypothetical protein
VPTQVLLRDSCRPGEIVEVCDRRYFRKVSGDIEADSCGRGNGETAQCGDFIGSEPLVASDAAGRAVIVSP